MTKVFRSIALAATLTVTAAAQAPTARDEEFARRQYESGLTFLQNKRYAEALKDFQVVIDSFPKSGVADDAMLQIALYQLDIANDLAAAQTATDKLLKEYPDTDSTPMAYVIAGRLTIAKGRTASDVDTALASFDRVPRLFPGSSAVPAAGFYAGETLRMARRTDDAIARFERVTMEYPRSIWAARAALGEAMVLAQADRATRVMGDLQHVRQQFEGTPEAAAALDLNTIIYRLFVRAPAQPAYAFSGRTVADAAKLKDVFGLTVDPTGRLLVGHKQGVSAFDAKAALVRTVAADDPSAFFVDERGRIVVARRDLLIADGAETTPLGVPATAAAGKGRQIEEVPSVETMSNGDRLVVDRKSKVVLRFTAGGKYLSTFAAVNAERLAISRLDDVAMIDRDSKGIVVTDRDGKVLSKIPAKGAGYELDNPIDLAFDPLGHLYVLDRGKPSVVVFGAKNRAIATIAIPEKDPGAFQKPDALAVDGAGRLYIFDDRSQRVQVYQ